MVCEVNYFFPIYINSHYYALQRTKSIKTIISIRTIINGNGDVICYGLKDVLPPCLRSISQYDNNTLSPLNITMIENDNKADENDLRESIEF